MQSTVAYETSASRIAVAYRLVTQSVAARTLLLTVPGRQPVPVIGWDGEVITSYAGHEFSHLQSYESGSFDRVVLHWALDEFVACPGRRRSAAGQDELLLEARRLLKPGGAVAGCAANLLALANDSEQLRPGRTYRSLQARLMHAGFCDPAVSIVLPSGDAPRTIVSTAIAMSRHYFDEQVKRTSFHRRGVRQWVRGSLVRTGLNRYLQGALMFVGRAP